MIDPPDGAPRRDALSVSISATSRLARRGPPLRVAGTLPQADDVALPGPLEEAHLPNPVSAARGRSLKPIGSRNHFTNERNGPETNATYHVAYGGEVFTHPSHKRDDNELPPL